MVEPPEIGGTGSAFTNHRLVTGIGLSKGLEAPIQVDVVNHQSVARFHGCPGVFQLETHIAPTNRPLPSTFQRRKVNAPENRLRYVQWPQE